MFDWLDLNHDGIKEPGEEYITFRFLEKMKGIPEKGEEAEIRDAMKRKDEV